MTITMNKITLTIALATAFAIGFLAPALAEPGPQSLHKNPTLRESVVVSDGFVRLGDLFNDVGDKAETAVAYAPRPGQQAVFDARWLFQVARHHGIAWAPAGRDIQAVVARESNLITRGDVEDAILREMQGRGITERLTIELANRTMQLHVPATKIPTVAVEDLSFDQASRRFVAVIAYPANDPSANRLRLSGRAHPVVEIPVLIRPMQPGDTIGEDAVRWIDARVDQVPHDVIADAGRLIGMTPKRRINVGAPIRANQVEAPVLVPRRSLVTMVLTNPLMTITAQGRALEDGALGEVVRVTNIQSNQTVEAVVIGHGRVTVRPAGSGVGTIPTALASN